jgi:Protein of unknown function (DUF3168)
MADSSDIDNALVAKLGADTELLALCPNGVYFDLAPPNASRYVLVSIHHAEDEATFDGTAIETVVYAVKVVMDKKAGGDIKAAAARVHGLLHEQPLTVAGYAWMTMHRDEDDPRIRITEPDDKDPSIIWYHRGGNYRVEMATA